MLPRVSRRWALLFLLASIGRMRVRITRQPLGMVQGVSLKHYRPGEVYELPPPLAEYLVIERFAIFEMRAGEKPPVEITEERRRRISALSPQLSALQRAPRMFP
jgi:hypothetical protein